MSRRSSVIPPICSYYQRLSPLSQDQPQKYEQAHWLIGREHHHDRYSSSYAASQFEYEEDYEPQQSAASKKKMAKTVLE